MNNKLEILIPEATYHIYNRANGSERLFLLNENYRYFLQQYCHYISPIAHTFCYCLMPNHFHFLIRIKSEEELRQVFPKFETLEKLLSKQFSNLFSSYTQAFNKQQKRMGSLFIKNFKRKRVNERSYLLKLVHYIHHNQKESRLCRNLEDWPHSSYSVLISDEAQAPFLNSNEVFTWFGDRENFIHFHSEHPLLKFNDH